MSNVIKVKFDIEGPALKNSVPLIEVITALHEFHFIVDKAWLAKSNMKRIPKNRDNYGIVATDFRRASFHADLIINATAVAVSLPGISAVAYKDLWEVVKSSYDFLKVLFEKRRSGVEPVITVGGDVNAPIIVGNNITVNHTVMTAADSSERHFRRLTNLVNPKVIDSISSFDTNGVGFSLTKQDKELFNPKTRLDPDIITIQCNIYKFDKNSNYGKVTVFAGQAIPPCDYSFAAVRTSDSAQFIEAMLKSSVEIKAMREIEVHATGVERISALRVVTVCGLGQRGLFE